MPSPSQIKMLACPATISLMLAEDMNLTQAEIGDHLSQQQGNQSGGVFATVP